MYWPKSAPLLKKRICLLVCPSLHPLRCRARVRRFVLGELWGYWTAHGLNLNMVTQKPWHPCCRVLPHGLSPHLRPGRSERGRRFCGVPDAEEQGRVPARGSCRSYQGAPSRVFSKRAAPCSRLCKNVHPAVLALFAVGTLKFYIMGTWLDVGRVCSNMRQQRALISGQEWSTCWEIILGMLLQASAKVGWSLPMFLLSFLSASACSEMMLLKPPYKPPL